MTYGNILTQPGLETLFRASAHWVYSDSWDDTWFQSHMLWFILGVFMAGSRIRSTTSNKYPTKPKFGADEEGEGVTLWSFNIAMENGPFIDDFPIKTSIYGGFSMAMLSNQMVLLTFSSIVVDSFGLRACHIDAMDQFHDSPVECC